MGDDDEARAKVRRLLLSGDNTLKNRDDPASAGRARARFEEALAVAQDAGLDEALITIIRRRLEPARATPPERDRGLADA